MMDLASINEDARSMLEMQSDCDCHGRHRSMIKMRQTMPHKRGCHNQSKVSIQNSSQGVDLVNFFNSPSEYDANENFKSYRSPCRRTCSTTHNPMFHNPRFNLNKIMCRPNSAERTKEQKRMTLLKIDFHETNINRVVEGVQHE